MKIKLYAGCALLMVTIGCTATTRERNPANASTASSCTDEFQAIAARESVTPVQRANQVRALAPRCEGEFEPMLRELAKAWHHRGIEEKEQAYLTGARPLYELYEARFADAEAAPEMRYYHAEVLWQLAEGAQDAAMSRALWVEAGRLFGAVADEGALGPKLAKESAYACLLAYKNATAAGVNDAPRAGGPDDFTERPIPGSVQGLIAAFRRYARYVEDPADPELLTMKFLEARAYWQYNHFARAVPLLGDIVRTHRDHETAAYAVNLLLDSLNILGQHERMEEWVDLVLADEAFLEDKEEMAERLRALRYQIRIKRAQGLETAGRFAACAQVYTELARSPSPGARIDEALYNAGVCHEQAGNVAAAISAYQQLETDHPQSRLAGMAAERRVALGGKAAQKKKARKKARRRGR